MADEARIDLGDIARFGDAVQMCSCGETYVEKKEGDGDWQVIGGAVFCKPHGKRLGFYSVTYADPFFTSPETKAFMAKWKALCDPPTKRKED